MTKYLMLLLLVGLGVPLRAQQRERQPLPFPEEDPIAFEHLTTNDGLSQTRIYSIMQDHKGFMWFGTQNGLNKYDGYGFIVYHHNPNDFSSLQLGDIRGLHEDTRGRLWVGTPGGLSYLDPQTERFIHYLHVPGDSTSLSEDNVQAIVEDTQGMLWVGTSGGLNRFNVETETFVHFRHNPDDSTSLSDDNVQTILEDTQGMLWVGTSGGLNRFDVETETFVHFRHNPDDSTSLSDDNVQAILEDTQGVLWVGTRRGLNRFNPLAETFTRFKHDPNDPTSLLNEEIRAIEEDYQGVLWIGTGRLAESGSEQGGLSRFDRETRSFIHFRYDKQFPGSLKRNSVTSIYSDRQGVLWVGNKGLSRVDRSTKRFGLYRNDGGDANELRWSNIRALYEDHTGVLWITVGGDGVRAFDRSTRVVTAYRNEPTNPEGIGPGNTWAMLEDHTGTLWMGNEWLSRFDRTSGTFIHYKPDPDDPTSLSSGSIYSLHEDRKGRLWIGHNGGGGLDRLDLATGTIAHYRHDSQDSTSIGSGTVAAIYEDQEGMLWIGIGGGKFDSFNPTTGRFKHFSYGVSDFMSITERRGEPGILWLSSMQGLVRFDIRSEAWTHYTMQNSDLPNNRVWGALEDEAGNLWLNTEGGLSRFHPDTGTFKNFDVDDGLQDKEFNAFSFDKSPSGEMFFGGINGINYFFPDQIQDNTTPPEVVLTAFRLFNQLQRPGLDSPLSVPIADTDLLSLAHNENNISFDYAGLHYRKPEKNQYQYMLEGYDEVWQEVGTLRRASYTSLPPNSYTFHVKASNSDGVWSEDKEGASVRIIISPPWWRTVWAYVLYGLFFIAGVYALDQFQRKRLIRKERERARDRELEQAQEIEKAHIELKHTHGELEQAHVHLKTTQQQLIQQEKMASLGQLTAGIAHEIKNPLNFINNFAELTEELAQELREALANGEDVLDIIDDVEQNAQRISQHGKRADGIVKSMMQHASSGSGERKPTDVNALVSQHIDLASHGKGAQVPDLKVEIEQDMGEDVDEVEIVPQEIGRVLLSLLGNAFDAVREQAIKVNDSYVPTVRVSTRQVEGQLEIRVSDNGPGIPAKIKDRIFEPFFTTKPTGTGTGLGLSLSYDIVTQGHGGRLTVESTEGEGATFVITLPVNSPNTG